MTAAYAVYWRTREDLIALRKEKFLPSGIKNIFLAREMMKHNPITVTRDTDLAEAAQIMSNNRISGLPVVNSVGILVGIGLISPRHWLPVKRSIIFRCYIASIKNLRYIILCSFCTIRISITRTLLAKILNSIILFNSKS
jgi:CBS-domain-containing membrane protein